MLIEIKKILGLDVGALDVASKVGRVEKVIVDPEQVKAIGMLVKIGTIFPKYKVLSFDDVVDFDTSGVVISSEENLLEKDEIVRISEILRYKFSLIGLRVKDEKKRSLGFVEDALIEKNSGDAMRIYTRDLLNIKNFVFERSRIVKITRNEVIVKSIEEKKTKSEELEAAKKVAQVA